MFSFPTEKFLESEQRKRFFLSLLQRIFLRDWGTKLIALAITIGIWFGVTGQTTTRRIQTIHLNFIPPNTMQISNEPIHEIEITVSGDKNKIDRLKAEDLVATVDLSSVNSGEKVVELQPENVSLDLPSGIKLTELQPNKILVKLEKTVEREIEVSAETEGNLANGFEIYGKFFSPAKVRVRGPESIVKSLENLLTEKIDIDGKNDSFTQRQLVVNSPNPKVTVIDTFVDATFKIGEKRIEKIYYVAQKSENSTKHFNVTILAPNNVLEKIKAEDIQIETDSSGEFQAILPDEFKEKAEIKTIKPLKE